MAARRLIAALALLLPNAAGAHDWYPSDCCNQKDCRPVEEGVVVDQPGGVMVKGFGFVFRSDPRLRVSPNGEDHVCSASGRLYCVFRKLNGM